MKVKVLVAFHDINNFRTVHHVGDVCDFEDSRCERLVSLGYAEYVDAPKTEEVAEPSRTEKVSATLFEEQKNEAAASEAPVEAPKRGRKPKTEE